MDYKIKYTQNALGDLDTIFDFILNVSLSGAKNKISKIRSKVNQLTFMPSGFSFDNHLGKKLNDEFKTEGLICDDYLILFVVDEDKKEVIVTHVISSKSNYMKVLK